MNPGILLAFVSMLETVCEQSTGIPDKESSYVPNIVLGQARELLKTYKESLDDATGQLILFCPNCDYAKGEYELKFLSSSLSEIPCPRCYLTTLDQFTTKPPLY